MLHEHKTRRAELRKGNSPISSPFLILGVLMAALVCLLLLKYVPGALPRVQGLFRSKETSTATTTGTFYAASDLYTARIHECDLLKYRDDNRDMTMIIRYHVNAIYNLSQVSFTTSEAISLKRTTSAGIQDSLDSRAEISTPNQLQQLSISIHLPKEKMEVVLENFAGMTGNLPEGELPGIEIFEYNGTFKAIDDDSIANSYLQMYTSLGWTMNMSMFLNEGKTLYDDYLGKVEVFDGTYYESNVNNVISSKRSKLVHTAQTTVKAGLEQYFRTLGYQAVNVLDTDGKLIAD